MIRMQTIRTEYVPELLAEWKNKVTEEQITKQLTEYAEQFDSVIKNENQRVHFENYIKGLMSNLERKSVEPIALRITGEKGVRSLQQFMTRSPLDDEKILNRYQEIAGGILSSGNGMLSVDSSENAKKGKHSAGVGRQYCGRLGKVENCQSGVFCAYAGENGYALVDRELYFQQKWFTDEYADLRKECDVPENKKFQTKNEIALKMIKTVYEKSLFKVKWVGCDSAFGSDHEFLDSLPKDTVYFASIKSNERVFLPETDMPLKVESLAADENFAWQNVKLADGSKGAICSDVKIIRCRSCRTISGASTPHTDVWVYIRKYKNGDIKFYISNASENTAESELHEAATLRWPIEQCFEECKTSLGMGHFEGRSYGGIMRHWLLVMIAHLFTTSLRLGLKKRCP